MDSLAPDLGDLSFLSLQFEVVDDCEVWTAETNFADGSSRMVGAFAEFSVAWAMLKCTSIVLGVPVEVYRTPEGEARKLSEAAAYEAARTLN